MNPNPEPSSWIRRFAGRVHQSGSVLDVACGGGRHAQHLADLGYRVTAVDIDTTRIKVRCSGTRSAGSIDVVTTDLECGDWPLEADTFDAVIVVNYLYRPHLQLLANSLAQGGLLLFDTFAAGNEFFGRPRNPDYLLRPGELLREFGSILDVIAYEHGRTDDAVRQSLCAVRR